MGHLPRGVRRRRGATSVSVAPRNTVTVTPSTFSLTTGSGTQVLTIDVKDAALNQVTGLAISVTSSNTSVATVSLPTGNGPYSATVTAGATGNVTISVVATGVYAVSTGVVVANPAWQGSVATLLGPVPSNFSGTARRLNYIDIYNRYLIRFGATNFSMFDANVASYASPATKWDAVLWGNYYQRPRNLYAIGSVTGDASGDIRYMADWYTRIYRDDYLIPNGWGPAQQWNFPETLAAHYYVTGDTVSRDGVARLANRINPGFLPANLVSGYIYSEGRVYWMCTMAAVWSHMLGLNSTIPPSSLLGISWAKNAELYADAMVLNWQTTATNNPSKVGMIDMGDSGNPADTWKHGQGNFQVGMMADALYAVHTNIIAKQAYIDCVVSMANYVYTTQRNPVANGFIYQNRRSSDGYFFDPVNIVGDRGPYDYLLNGFIAKLLLRANQMSGSTIYSVAQFGAIFDSHYSNLLAQAPGQTGRQKEVNEFLQWYSVFAEYPTL